MTLQRLFGKEVYNLLSGGPRVVYRFNENLIVSEEVPGKLQTVVAQSNDLRNNPLYVESLIRLSAFSELVPSRDYIKGGFNCNVDSKFNIIMFDFDASFAEGENLQPMVCYGNLSLIDYEKIINDEREKILQRAKDNREELTSSHI
jgi:hypothetical protein